MEAKAMERRAFERRTFAERSASTKSETEAGIAQKRNYFPLISWGAISGGLASGIGTYIMLALLGLAAGLTAINPQSAEPVGMVPMMTGIWTSVSLVLSAFVGGYVAARMSGLSRMADGILHGLVAWGASMLIFAFLVTTSIGSALGGAFSLVGQGAKAVAGGAAVTAGGVAKSPSSQGQLESLLKGSAGGGGDINTQSVANLKDRLSAGDRDGAIFVMTNQMGFTQERASQVVDQGMSLYRNLPQQARDTASSAVSGLSKITWGIFFGVLLSMGLGVAGGVVGAKAADKRRHPLAST